MQRRFALHRRIPSTSAATASSFLPQRCASHSPFAVEQGQCHGPRPGATPDRMPGRHFSGRDGGAERQRSGAKKRGKFIRVIIGKPLKQRQFWILLMVALNTPACDSGWPAPAFFRCRAPSPHTPRLLPWTERPAGGLHLQPLPYVQAILDRLIRDAAELQALGVGVVAISSNDATAYPEDGFSRWSVWPRQKAFLSLSLRRIPGRRPCLWCGMPPDFFGFDHTSICAIAAGSMPAALTHPRPAADCSGQTQRSPTWNHPVQRVAEMEVREPEEQSGPALVPCPHEMGNTRMTMPPSVETYAGRRHRAGARSRPAGNHSALPAARHALKDDGSLFPRPIIAAQHYWRRNWEIFDSPIIRRRDDAEEQRAGWEAGSEGCGASTRSMAPPTSSTASPVSRSRWPG